MRVCPRCKATYVALRAACALDNERLIETDRDPLVGESIERYQIVEYLGSGGMGRVYRARHTTIDREYAIKVLYGDLATDEMFRARFQREASAISRIRHANVVSVSDFGSTEAGLSFIVMELISGRTLLRTIDEDGPLVPPRAGHIARQIAEALSAAHAAGYVHRDIKSSNVMLVGRGPTEQVKVLDFGTVSLTSQKKFDDRLTTVGQLIGTPAYMAPEQFEDPAVGPSADLYSLGVVLYHMLSGRLPFTSSRPAELMVMHLTHVPPPLPECGGLEKLATRLLQKQPDKRLRSAQEVIASIDSLILDGSSDGFTTDTEQVQVQTAPTRPAAIVEMISFDRPPIAEADTPREDDVPTLRPEDAEDDPAKVSGDLEAPALPVEHDQTESATMRDTEPDDLRAPGLPAGASAVRVDSAETKLLLDSSPHPPPPPRRSPWPLVMFVTGFSALALVLLISRLNCG